MPEVTGQGRYLPGELWQDAIMAKWEYVTVPLIVHATKQILDQWGDQGYELVQVVTGEGGNLVAYLKREKAE